MGLSISNPSATVNSKLLVTKANTAGEATLGTATIAGAAATTASAWGQVSASLSADTIITQATIVSSVAFTVTDEIYVEVSYGGAGSETAVSAIPLLPGGAPTTGGTGTNKVAMGAARIPARIASGQRLAVRITCSTATLNGNNVTIRLFGATYTNLEGN